jgi:insulysin
VELISASVTETQEDYMNLFRLGYLTLFFAIGLSSVSAFAISPDHSITPRQSPNDDRDYRYEVLENGLQVLLVSDPGADKGAAALDVFIGSGDELEDRLGIAHFLEHMLFLGTEKYPDAGEYQQYISNHGGSHNASTSFQHTNYFFDVNGEFLEPALDRFAQQFVAPLFNPELIERERNAVHSEYTSKLQDDGRRFFSAFKAALNPEHRYNRFAVGNLDTLGNEDGTLRQDVVEFYREHYRAGLMTLAVYGPQSLDTLESWVRTKFADLPSGPGERYRHEQPLLESDALPASLKVEALKDTRRLQLYFPIPSLMDEYHAKPASYVANLVGHEGPGSLLDVLKQAGLVNGLSAGSSYDTGASALFQVSLSLTPEGLEQWREVVALTFEYIEKIREQGIARSYFDEQQRLAEISFRFAEKSQPIHLVSRLAGTLHVVDPEDVLSAPYLMDEYAPKLYRDILERLRPDNVLVSLLAPGTVDENASRTRWYDTAYQLQPLEPEAITDAGDLARLSSQLALPEPNPFIPENLDLVEGDRHEQPIKLATEPFTIWYGRDTSFGTPRANVYLSLRSPAANGSVRDNLLTQLWVDSMRDQINAYAYSAQLAGLDYTVYSHLRGITLRVSGYSDKLHELLDALLKTTMDTELLETRFQIHRRQLIESLENARKDKPYNQALGLLSERLLKDLWPLEERLETARGLSFEDLEAFVPRFLSELDPVMLAHGNLTPAAGLNLGSLVKARLSEKTDFIVVPRSEVRRLESASNHLTLPVTHPDTGYVRYIQGADTSYDARAGYRLLSQLVSTPFYHSLRTEQQLGYIVFANAYELLEVPGLAFVIQSPVANGQKLDRQVKAFLDKYGDNLETMSEEALERQKASVISRLLEEDKTLHAISERWWREIDRENVDFNSREQIVEAVRKMDLETVQGLYATEVEPLLRSLWVTTETVDGKIEDDAS